MATTIGGATGASPVWLSGVNDFAGIEAELQMVQYEVTRQMTRLIAAKASQIQTRAELVASLASLKASLGTREPTGANEDFPSELVESLGDPARLLELDAWLERNNAFPGSSSAERAQWQALLSDAGYPLAQKVPVFLQTRTSVYSPQGQSQSTTVTNELVWMDQAQRDHLAATMSPNQDVDYEVSGVAPLMTSRLDSLENGNTQVFIAAAWCLDRGAGPHLSEQEIIDLADSVTDTLSNVSGDLGRENAGLRLQNATLASMLEGGERMIKEIRDRRAVAQALIDDEDQSLAERAQVRQQYLDRKNAQPAQAGAPAPVPGSLRSAPFPTTTPTPPAVAPDPKEGDGAFFPRRSV